MKHLLFSVLLSLFAINLAADYTPAKDPTELTLSIIKPDAVSANHIGNIISRFEAQGLRIAAIKMQKLSKEQAESFYAVHKGKPFFNDLTDFMSSGPIVPIVLQGENAILKNREIMGATDFKNAEKGTIRKDLASSVTKNAVHGSDSQESAKTEIAFFFTSDEIFTKPHAISEK